MVVPPFEAGMPLPTGLSHKSHHGVVSLGSACKSVQTEDNKLDSYASESSVPSVAPVVSLSQNPNVADVDALSSIAEASSFDDMERTIARAQQTKVC